MPAHKLNTAPRLVQRMVRQAASDKAITSRHIVDNLPGVNRYNVLRWLEGEPRRLAEGTIDRILEVVTKAPQVP